MAKERAEKKVRPHRGCCYLLMGANATWLHVQQFNFSCVSESPPVGVAHSAVVIA